MTGGLVPVPPNLAPRLPKSSLREGVGWYALRETLGRLVLEGRSSSGSWSSASARSPMLRFAPPSFALA